MRTLFPLLFLLAGCPKQPAAVAQAPEPLPVALATVLESAERRGLQPISDEVGERLSAELEKRNLVPTVVDGTDGLAGTSTTDTRLAWLAERSDGAKATLLVEVEARFSVQVNGRYRWTLDGQITLVPAGAEAPRTADLSIPVALVYSHQDEEDALTEASPQIARRLGALLDGWLTSDGSY